ncbi:hypothetical protein ES705_48079 [subsurface metagenome]
MKKAFLFITVICFFGTSTIHAQTNQGKFIIGTSSTISLAGSSQNFMNLGFTSSKSKSDDYTSDSDKSTNFNLQPKAGYFVIDNLVTGLDITWIYGGSKSSEYDYKYSQTLIAFGPFVRYYIPAGSILPFFEIDGTLGTLIEKNDFTGSEDKDKSRVLSFSAKAGAAIPLGDVVLFEMMMLYNTASIKPKEDNNNNSRNVWNTFGINFGFIVLL